AKFFGLAIDDAELDIGKADDPIAGLGFGEAEGLAGERFADEHVVAAPLDLAGGPDVAQGMVGVVPGRFDAIGVAPRRRRVTAGRGRLAERLVRPVVVEVLAEAIEPRLLLDRIVGRRPRGLGLEGAMHAFVAGGLLPAAG